MVTSDYHTARSARIYLATERALGGGPAMRVVAAPDRHFQIDSWWKSREGLKTVFMEWSKTVATAVGSETVAVVPSPAVARKTALPSANACMTPFWSIVASAGVSDFQVNVVLTVFPLPSRSVSDVRPWIDRIRGNVRPHEHLRVGPAVAMSP